jgi:hypothetical protein
VLVPEPGGAGDTVVDTGAGGAGGAGAETASEGSKAGAGTGTEDVVEPWVVADGAGSCAAGDDVGGGSVGTVEAVVAALAGAANLAVAATGPW